jgi:hypothetical protein
MFEQFEMFMAGTTGVPEGNIEKSKTVESKFLTRVLKLCQSAQLIIQRPFS